MLSSNHAVQVDPHLVHDASSAVQLFESYGGHLTQFSPFGEDPLANNTNFIHRRETTFMSRYPTFDQFFHSVVNSDHSLFRQGLLFLISLSKQLEAELLQQ